MPYIGLCGLTLVSFCDSAGMTVPLVPAMALALAPRLHAAQVRAVRVKRRPKLVDEAAGGARVGHHGAGQPKLVVARHAQEIELAAWAADQDVRAGDVAAARKIEADEGNLAGARADAAGGQQRLRYPWRAVAARVRGPRSGQHAQTIEGDHRGGARHEALRDELPPRRRPRVILVSERFVQSQSLLLSCAYEMPLRFVCLIDQHVGAAEGGGAGCGGHGLCRAPCVAGVVPYTEYADQVVSSVVTVVEAGELVRTVPSTAVASALVTAPVLPGYVEALNVTPGNICAASDGVFTMVLQY
jgi:hypothetical protein